MCDCWQIVGDYGDDFHAGPKAQNDIAVVLDRMGVERIVVGRTHFGGPIGRLLNRLLWFARCRLIRAKLPRKTTVIMQCPTAAWSKSAALCVLNERVKARKDLRLVTIVHDIASLRVGDGPMAEKRLNAEEERLFALFDKIVVHNEQMKRALIERGVPADRLVPLEIFDYLIPGFEPERTRSKSNEVIIAGNLAPDKTVYLKRLKDVPGVEWKLYGPNFDSAAVGGPNVHYAGCCSPDELPSKLEGAFGLVWDGLSIETCSGAYGEYTRINNPHKLSLYLASGIPVIVWREAAVARFVESHGVGVVVDSLNNLDSFLNGISEAAYDEMLRNSLAVSEKLRTGYFTRKVMTDE